MDTTTTTATAAAADPTNAMSTPPESFTTIGPYRIEGELGRGGMGVVLKAKDPLLGRSVAVKLLHPGALREPESRRRFVQEARALARLDHPNIVPIYGVGRHGDRVYIATQFVDGENLLEHLRRRGPLPVWEAYSIAGDVLGALGAIHAAGLVHRDVKTENVMRSEDGRIKLLDFGIVKDLRSDARITHTNLRLGTPHYTAPEQARGDKVDARTDVYSTGVVLYELLTGEIPFDGRGTTEIYRACLRGEWPSVSRRRPGLPRSADLLLEKFLAAEPGKRFASAAAAAAAVARARSFAPTPSAFRRAVRRLFRLDRRRG